MPVTTPYLDGLLEGYKITRHGHSTSGNSRSNRVDNSVKKENLAGREARGEAFFRSGRITHQRGRAANPAAVQPAPSAVHPSAAWDQPHGLAAFRR